MVAPIKIKFKKLNDDALPFVYTSEDDACMDIYNLNTVTILPGRTMKIPTGIGMELPHGYEGVIRGRSSLNSLGLLTHTGVIDEQYRGDVCVVITNLNKHAVTFYKHNRIAQFSIHKKHKINLEECSELTNTERGSKGFGSSGV